MDLNCIYAFYFCFKFKFCVIDLVKQYPGHKTLSRILERIVMCLHSKSESKARPRFTIHIKNSCLEWKI